jgi:hypothetical protein
LWRASLISLPRRQLRLFLPKQLSPQSWLPRYVASMASTANNLTDRTAIGWHQRFRPYRSYCKYCLS